MKRSGTTERRLSDPAKIGYRRMYAFRSGVSLAILALVLLMPVIGHAQEMSFAAAHVSHESEAQGPDLSGRLRGPALHIADARELDTGRPPAPTARLSEAPPFASSWEMRAGR